MNNYYQKYLNHFDEAVVVEAEDGEFTLKINKNT